MKLLTCPYSECSCYAVFPMLDCAQTHEGCQITFTPITRECNKIFQFFFHICSQCHIPNILSPNLGPKFNL